MRLLSFTVILVVVLTFSSCKKITGDNSLFSEIPSSETAITFKNTLLEKKAFGILYYLYYFNGGGVAIGDINNDGLQDIYFTANNRNGNKLYLNKGNLRFEDITEKAKVAGTADWHTGATMADVNGDGWLDIYVSAVSQQKGLEGHNALYINQKNGTFEEQSTQYGLNFSGFSTQAAFFDYDHDGDLDCYLLNQSLQPNQNIRPAKGRADFDPHAGDRFYRNENGAKFTDISKEVGIYQSNLGYGLGISVADFNNDGWEDVYIGNDFHENDYYYINTGKGRFVESGEKHFRHYSRFSMGNDAADYDNDGQIDLVTVDMLPDNEKILKTYGSDEQFDTYQYKIISNGFQYQFSKNCLQNNNGNGQSFSEVGLMAGVSATDWSWCPLFVDFDNDSNKDLFISSGIVKRPVDLDYVKYVSDLYMTKGMNNTDKYDADALQKMPDGSSHPFFFKGDGAGSFKDESETWGTAQMKGYFNGAAYADLDNDGDMDMVINNIDAEASILRNNTTQQKSITINFEGENLNKFGIGAKVYLFSNQKMQHQQLMATRGFQSSSQLALQFGLGKSSKIDSILVIWNDQRYQVIKNINNQNKITLKQKEASGKFDYATFFAPQKEILENITSKINLTWKHQENLFQDFNSQPLLPHKLSTKGPKIAVGDINNDGLDDFYACGASNQAGVLMIQQRNGSFTVSSQPTFAQDALQEDVDAVFFDANKDGFQDLLVISGGNEFENGRTELQDRLYLNNQKGGFSEANFPAILENKSCVSIADIDADGDSDVFIGSLSPANAYGILSNSHLLINDGNANFTPAPDSQINLKEIGIVNTAAFADINKDNKPDLVVAGDFMPITIFVNKGGRFDKTTLPNSSGLWQGTYVNDVNDDGNLDILAGNWGLNNKFCSNKDGKIKLYSKDFDKNGKIDQLLSYSILGKEYPFLPKDEMEKPMPVLRKHYQLYTDYAGLEMKDAFLGFVEQVTPLEAEKLSSVVCFGDGKGGFSIVDLPRNLQKSPIFSFQNIGNGKVVAVGNFYDSPPYEGRYDAQPMALFTVKNTDLNYLHQPNLYNFNKQARDIKQLRTINNQKIFVVAFNNDALEVLRMK
ncbi:MAG: VCBS repeat-containing protein [Spirosomataceae bacterium]